jgi:hypothetical protein
VRTEDWKGPDGKTARMVYADWRSTGDRPVHAVVATVRVIGQDGKAAFETKSVLIYVAPAAPLRVGLGDGYHEPEGEGV